MVSWVVGHLPPHRIYVEPFGGGASVLLAKLPSPVEVYNDADHALYELFVVLADPAEFERFYRRVAALPCSRELYRECRDTWRLQTDRLERVWRWFVVARQSFAGRFGRGWGSVVKSSSRGMVRSCSDWLSAIDRLPEIHARLQRVQIESADWRVILDRYDTPETLFYLDPPYVPSTRRNERYRYELSEDDHREMVDRLLALQGMAVLSGYPNAVYEPLESAGWKRVERQTACHAAGRTRGSGLQGKGAVLARQPRTECLWIKPAEQLAALSGADNG
jgi:DNA adenine methylase